MIASVTTMPFVPVAHSTLPAALYSTRLPSLCSVRRYDPLTEYMDWPTDKVISCVVLLTHSGKVPCEIIRLPSFLTLNIAPGCPDVFDAQTGVVPAYSTR